MKRLFPLHKRTLLMAALLLVGGALINIAVAWGCAYWVNAYDHGHGTDAEIADDEFPGQRRWTVRRRDAFGATRLSVLVIDGRNATTIADQTALFPGWSRLRTNMQQNLAAANATSRPANTLNPPRPMPMVEDARGWPVRALTCSWDHGIRSATLPAPSPLQCGLELPIYGGLINRGALDYARALPLRPIWPGFAMNTVFYAVILWVLFAAPFALRRSIRRRRGLCPACAYPVGTSDICTECGKPLVKDKTETQKAETQKAETT